MTNSFEPETSATQKARDADPSAWFKLGVVAAASVLAGGLAAAWWYRKALLQLRQAEEKPSNPQYGISGEDPEDEA